MQRTVLAVAVASVIVVIYFLVFWPLRDPHPGTSVRGGDLAIRNAKIYVSPDVPPVENGSIVVRHGVIVALGANTPIPPEMRTISCAGCVVTAGFWNTHVHFTQPAWDFAAWKSAEILNSQLRQMLTSHGFSTVVDAGSNPWNTIPLRRRIAHGDLQGPLIYTAGSALYPPNGIPFYIRKSTPFFIRWLLAQPSGPDQAVKEEEQNMERGADLLKLFTGSYIAPGKVLPMPEPIAKAAVGLAHRHGQIAYSHPSDLAGTLVALHSGVDVLAHAPDTPDGIDANLLSDLVQHRMAMVPTLKMFATTVTTKPAYLDPVYAVVREFHRLGGQLMFGTDVGYMTDYDTTDEFRALGRCGLNAMDMLRMLTTAPAERFGVGKQTGVVGVGKVADLVVLEADPATDVTSFARVKWTIRNGRVIYARQ